MEAKQIFLSARHGNLNKYLIINRGLYGIFIQRKGSHEVEIVDLSLFMEIALAYIRLSITI